MQNTKYMTGVHISPSQWGKETIIPTLDIMTLNMFLKGDMSN